VLRAGVVFRLELALCEGAGVLAVASVVFGCFELALPYVGARGCGAGSLLGVLAAAHSALGARCECQVNPGARRKLIDACGPVMGHKDGIVLVSSGGLELAEDMVDASADLAGDGEVRALGAGAVTD